MEKLRELLQLFGLKDIEVDIKSMNNANLIGTGMRHYHNILPSLPASSQFYEAF